MLIMSSFFALVAIIFAVLFWISFLKEWKDSYFFSFFVGSIISIVLMCFSLYLWTVYGGI